MKQKFISALSFRLIIENMMRNEAKTKRKEAKQSKMFV
jgi:hypothetical protein